MNSITKITVLFFLFFLMINYISFGQHIDSSALESRRIIWQKISRYFSPPEQYKGKYDHYRSPLKFYNGDTVKTKADWIKRRKEILTQWNKMMGKWPPLLKDQKLEITDSMRRENFTQYRVKFRWLPNQTTEGYLLVPDGGKEKKPAVITVYYEPETA